MYTSSDNIEIMFGDDNDDIIEQLFESLLQKYEENLQNKMRGSVFEFDGVSFLYYDFNKTSINRGGSYIDSPKWLKDKKSTINLKNNDDKCFQYAVTLALNLDKIKKDPQRVSKIKPFMEKYNWEDIDFPSTSKDWKKIECNNEVALNILYVPYNTKKINIAYKSKNNLTHERQIILLMISDNQRWHYLVVKNLSGLLRGITSNHKEDFYCLNCFHSYSKLESHKKICENHDYCHVEMPTKDNNIIKYNHGEKSMQVPFIIYADLESLLEKMTTCINNPNESSTTEINKHTPSGYLIFTSCSFDESKNKLNYYRGKDCMKKFCKDLKENFSTIKKKIENKNLEITYKIKFIDSFRFISSSLSKLVDNLSEGIHNNKCADCKSNLDYIKITAERKNEKLFLECYNCKQRYRKKFNKELIKRFASTYEFCNNDLNKFVLLLGKGVYPYEYADTWEKFREISLPSKENFYSYLNMEDISDIEYRYANNVFKVFKLENLGNYHDLYVQSDTLLLADVFNNFRDMCIKEYELDPAHFLSLPGLAWQACLKKLNIELELLTDCDMLLMIEEGIRG